MGIQPFDPLALSAMRSSGYALKDALCELIDNSIWHGEAKNIEIKMSWLDESSKTSRSYLKEVFVADDGEGMDQDTLGLSVQIGKSTTFGSTDNFGRFGYGMIAGALTQCTLVEIYSKTKNGDWNFIQYDFNKVSQGELIPEPIKQNPPEKYISIIKNKGTIIIWSLFDSADAFSNDWDVINAGGQSKGDLGYLSYDLGRIYRKIIGEEIVTADSKIKGKNLGPSITIKNDNIRVITLNGRKVTPWDPLFMLKIPGFEKDSKPTKIFDELILDVETHPMDKKRAGKEIDQIHIRLTILNEKWRQQLENKTNPEQKGVWERLIHFNQGISVLRQGREVSFDRSPNVWTSNGTLDRFWGCEIDFPSTLDKRFEIKNVKIGIKCDKALTEQLKKHMSGSISAAIKIISHDMQTSRSKAEEIANKGPHDVAEERFRDTDVGTKPTAEIISVEEKEKAQIELAERFSEHGEKLDKEKFGEIGVIFQDDIKMYENGPFLEVKNNLGNNIVIYNLQHPFFKHLDSVYSKLKQLSAEESIEQLLGRGLTKDEKEVRKEFNKQIANTRYLVDLLLGSFAATKGDLDHDRKQTAGSTINSMLSRWTDNLFTVTNDKNFGKRVNDEV